MNTIKSLFFSFPFSNQGEKVLAEATIAFHHSCPCLCIYICNVLVPKSISGKESHTSIPLSLFKEAEVKGEGEKSQE